ncbi:MAG: isoprenylcysteine carboxylmethyltransferase family protein [Anaerolineales bacterium]|nr:isoprenylcysteine carboxylmethyltransferase family protein [Anaerolineales bacterium]
MLLRHLLSILLLPFMATAVVPYLLYNQCGGLAANAPLLRGLGALLFLAGLSLLGWCIYLFARVGRGTLAPWDPTQALVAAGPYAYTRNPMISGVAAMLAGQALWLRSPALVLWALAFALINHAYFVWSEEPGLEQRFGQSYRDYKARVPRWLPKLWR